MVGMGFAILMNITERITNYRKPLKSITTTIWDLSQLMSYPSTDKKEAEQYAKATAFYYDADGKRVELYIEVKGGAE